MRGGQIISKWRQLKGRAKGQWKKLTEDELEVIEEQRNRFAGKAQKIGRYANVQTKRKVQE